MVSFLHSGQARNLFSYTVHRRVDSSRKRQGARQLVTIAMPRLSFS